METGKTIYTIGHSTRSEEEFIFLLNAHHIETVADIRNYPGSRKFPHLNQDQMMLWLTQNNINYTHYKNLGGRRKPNAESKNTAWRLPAFRAYADYMETEEFKEAIEQLQAEAKNSVTAYMCSEAVWWSCHRSLVSDYLKSIGWKVLHIMSLQKSEEHPYTSAAQIIDGGLSYQSRDLFS